MRNLVIIAGIVVLIVLAAALASPLLGLQSVRDAVSGRDEATLAGLIDSDRLRESLASRVRARYAQASIKLPIEPLVERLITPNGLITAICDGGVVTQRPPLPNTCDIQGSLNNIRFESTERFSAALTQAGRINATIVMDRDGARWKLVDMVLPASAYDQLKNSLSN